MPAISGVARNNHVYSPCQTLPIVSPKRGLLFCSLGWIKNSAGCLCRRPAEESADNAVKTDITKQLNQFFMHGKDILSLNSNQQSVLDNFQTWLRQHEGTFTREDQQIIKDYCQELKAIILPSANETQREALQANVSEIDNIADRIFSDVRLVVGK